MDSESQQQQIAVIGIMVLALLSWPMTTGSVYASQLSADQAEILNMAGRQRMLVQRITKAYCLSVLLTNSLSIPPGKYNEQLLDAVNRYDQQHARLKIYAKHNELRDMLDKVSQQWNIYKAIAVQEPDRGKIYDLWQLDEQLLALNEQVVLLVEEQTRSRWARYVNVAGRQRMLSQRIAKLYMLGASGINKHAALMTALESARNEFRGALATLMEASDNTELIRIKLTEASKQWQWLNGALEMHPHNKFPTIVDDASEKTLRLMEDVTGLYEELAAVGEQPF